MSNQLIQITSSYFCAGVTLQQGVVTRIAPILKYMIYWTEERVQLYCKEKGWTYEQT